MMDSDLRWAEKKNTAGQVKSRANSWTELKWKKTPKTVQQGQWHDGVSHRRQTQACGNKFETRNLKANMGR